MVRRCCTEQVEYLGDAPHALAANGGDPSMEPRETDVVAASEDEDFTPLAEADESTSVQDGPRSLRKDLDLMALISVMRMMIHRELRRNQKSRQRLKIGRIQSPPFRLSHRCQVCLSISLRRLSSSNLPSSATEPAAGQRSARAMFKRLSTH